MWRMTIKMMWRRLRSQTGFTLLNVLGLSLGLGAFLLLAAYVLHELSYDRGFADSDRLYRVQYELDNRGEMIPIALSPPALMNHLLESFPAVESCTRLSTTGANFRIGRNSIKVRDIAYVDTSFFDVFGLDLVYGDPDRVLREEHSLALSRSFAETHYPGRDPVGETIEWQETQYVVSAVYEDLPEPTHLELEVLAPFQFTS
ncbi:hypothetical protein GF324_13485, partial [bacterium]|nr:hypothetical protein [bacterium]